MPAAGKAEQAKCFADWCGLCTNAGKRARHVQILGRGQVILDRVGVSDVHELPPELLMQPPNILARPEDLAARRLEQAACDAKEARLAGAVVPCDTEQLAAAQREAQRAEKPALAAHALEIDRLERGGSRFFFHRSDLGGGELRPDLREQALAIAPAPPGDLVLGL